MDTIRTTSVTLWLTAVAAVGLPLNAATAHCDTMDGPLVTEARAALEQADVRPVLKWVRADDEAEVRAAFDDAVALRGAGARAQRVGELRFLETLVRLHRAGEGAPFTGLKPGGEVDPVIREADEALRTGQLDPLLTALTGHLAQALRERFEAAHDRQRRAGDDIESGRAFVASYVEWVHFVEGLHALIASPAGEATEPDTHHH